MQKTMQLDLSPEQLRQEANRLRAIAAKYEELAQLLEGGSIAKPALEHLEGLAVFEGKPPVKKKGESWRRVILAAATFGESTFSASDIVSALDKEVPEQTVYAIFRRDQGRDFVNVGPDPNNGRVTLFKLKGYSWIFTYGINMNARHLLSEFKKRNFDFNALVVGALIADLPDAKLSWRNKSSKWGGGTATYEDVPGAQLPGIAYLVRHPLGVQAFEAKEKPAYLPEQRNITIAGRSVPAIVFNVSNARREGKDISPATQYVTLLAAGAREHGLEIDV